MERDPLLLSEYQKILLSKYENLKKLLESLKRNYNRENMEAIRKEIHKIGTDTKAWGYLEVSQIAEGLEWGLIAKQKNFFLTKLPQNWFEEVETFLKKIQVIIEQGAVQKAEKKETVAPTETTPNQIHKNEEFKETEKKKIVIVDDDEDIVKLLAYEFTTIGYEVASFHTGGEALDFLSNEKNINDICLIILDRVLPDMDGLDILKQLTDSLATVPVLVISVLSSEQDIATGLQYGAIDYISKPFSVFMLLQKAVRLLKTQTF